MKQGDIVVFKNKFKVLEVFENRSTEYAVIEINLNIDYSKIDPQLIYVLVVPIKFLESSQGAWGNH